MTPHQLRPTTRTGFFCLLLPAAALLLQPATARADVIFAGQSGGAILRYDVNYWGTPPQTGTLTANIQVPSCPSVSPVTVHSLG